MKLQRQSVRYNIGVHVIFVHLSYVSATALAGVNINQFQISTVYNSSYGEVLDSTKIGSQLGCISKCSENAACRSVTFDNVSNICKTNRWHADATNTCDPGHGCSDPNAILYVEKIVETTVGNTCRNSLDCVDSLSDCVNGTCQCQSSYGYDVVKQECVLLTTMRLPCQTDAQCLDPNSICALNQCQCEPGYSYNGTSFACVTSCSSYGSTFQYDPGMKLQSNNDRAIGNSITLDECRSACLSETSFVCRTFEYQFTGNLRCHLQSNTALDLPTAYVTESTKDLYTRDCEY